MRELTQLSACLNAPKTLYAVVVQSSMWRPTVPHLVPGESPVEKGLEVMRLHSNGLAVLLYGCCKVALLAEAVATSMMLIG